MEPIDSKFVDLAIKKGYITFAKVRECIDSNRGGSGPVREMIVGLGWVTQAQHDEVMKEVLESPPRNGVMTDDKLCEELVRRGLVSAEGIYDAIRLSEKYRTRDRALKSLDEILIEMGFITAPQIEGVRGRDSAEPVVLSEPTHLKIGEFAVRKGYIHEKQLQECLAIQEEERKKGGTPRKLGEILLSKGFIDARRLQEILTRPTIEAKPLTIPGYELQTKLGQGAMGEIFRARQLSVDRVVAIKILPLRFARDPRQLESMVSEANLLARLDHTNIVKVIDAGRTQDRYYYVMEFVDGTTVQKMLDWQRKIPERECLKIGMYMGHALAHAAQHSLVHRDIKPGNIMITKEGTVKLFDLGIAKLLTGDARREDVVAGTPYYMSPEVCLRQPVDIRSDIYSLGATLYHCATGAPPFKGPTAESTAAMHVQREAIPPHEINPEISEEFSRAIMKMLRKDPAERYQTGDELARVLDDITKNQLEASLGTKVKTTRRGVKGPGEGAAAVLKTRVSWKAVLAAVAITLAICAGITTYLLWSVGQLSLPFLK